MHLDERHFCVAIQLGSAFTILSVPYRTCHARRIIVECELHGDHIGLLSFQRYVEEYHSIVAFPLPTLTEYPYLELGPSESN